MSIPKLCSKAILSQIQILEDLQMFKFGRFLQFAKTIKGYSPFRGNAP